MRKLILILILTFPLFSFSQNWADDSSLDEIINNKSAFGPDSVFAYLHNNKAKQLFIGDKESFWHRIKCT